VADLLRVPHEIAPLVELALGDAAQRFIVRSTTTDAVAALVGNVPGRVGFIPYQEAGDTRQEAGDRRQEHSLASRVESELPGLPEQLLGNVLLAESLVEARQLHHVYP